MKKLCVIILNLLLAYDIFAQGGNTGHTYLSGEYLGWGPANENELNLKTDGKIRMKIFDNINVPYNRGFVGIGDFGANDAPTTLLHLFDNTTDGVFQLFNNRGASWGNEYGFLVGLGGSGDNIDGVLASQSGSIKFFTKCCNPVLVGQIPYSPFPPDQANGNMRMIIDETGQVGVDAEDPIALLQIGNGNQKVAIDRLHPSPTNNWASMYLSFNGGKIGSRWQFESDGAHNAGVVFTTTPNGGLRISQIQESSIPTTTQLLTDADVINSTSFEITNEGKTLIGQPSVPSDPNNEIKLLVNGGILCERVKVAIDGSGNWVWPDFVFSKDYTLKSLTELESYILKNEHLPDVPSSCDIEKDGIDLANMNAKLLQKIEELTLHLIAQGKEIDNLKKAINDISR